MVLDQTYNIDNNYYYFTGKVKGLKVLKKIDEGTMPKSDDEMVIGLSDYDWYENDIFDSTFTLTNDNSREFGRLKVKGVVNMKGQKETIIFVSDKVIEKLRTGININYSQMSLTLNNNIYDYGNDTRLSFMIDTNNKIKEGTALVSEDLNPYCEKENCLNKNISINIKNIYYKDSISLKITDYYNSKTFTNKTSLAKEQFENYPNAIFVNPNDYSKLFSKGTYQSSVFLKDTKLSDNTIAKIQSQGFNTFYMRDIMKQENEKMNGIIGVLRTIMFTIAVIVLFFISYFIIKIILKSRNSYFGTIRTLGATKKISRSLLNIELLVDINVVYLIFIALINLVKHKIINISYIADMITYFQLKDYIIVYIILIIMSLLISTRYSRKLFKSSVMNAYREEV